MTVKPIILDGAMGTELIQRGVECPLPLWSADANLTHPEIVKKIPINTQTLGEADAQLKILAEKGEFLSEQAGEVLGEAIKATEGDEPLTEKAFEYGRYLYCQQVVEQWDKDQSN